MPSVIGKRPKDIPPHHQVPPPNGPPDDWRDGARKQINLLSTLDEKDPNAKRIYEAAVDVLNASEDCIRFLWDNADDHVKRMQAVEGFLQSTTRERIAATPIQAGWNVDDLKAGIAAKTRREAEAQITTEILGGDPLKQRAEDLAEKYRNAIQTFSTLLETLTAQHYGPRALYKAVDLSVMYQEAAIEREERLKKPQAWLDTYRGLVERGENDKADLYEAAMLPLVEEVMSLPPAKILARYGLVDARTDQGNEMRTTCLQLRNEMVSRRRATEPPSLEIGRRFLSLASGLFAEIVGTNARLMSSAEFQRRFLGPGNSQDPVDPHGVDESWLARRLPPSGSPPPGWSPIVRRTREGLVIRERG